MTRTYKITGKNIGTGESIRYDWSEGTDTRIVEVKRADQTESNDYVIVTITRNTAEECEAELNGQISDGLFENEKVENIEEITEKKTERFEIIGSGEVIEGILEGSDEMFESDYFYQILIDRSGKIYRAYYYFEDQPKALDEYGNLIIDSIDYYKISKLEEKN